jgi:hypothetical protein
MRIGNAGRGGAELPATTKRAFCPLERKAPASCGSRRCTRHDGRAARDTVKAFDFAVSISSNAAVGPDPSAAFATYRNRSRSLQCGYRARRQCRWASDFMAALHEERPRRLGEDEPSRKANAVWHRVFGGARDWLSIFLCPPYILHSVAHCRVDVMGRRPLLRPCRAQKPVPIAQKGFSAARKYVTRFPRLRGVCPACQRGVTACHARGIERESSIAVGARTHWAQSSAPGSANTLMSSPSPGGT